MLKFEAKLTSNLFLMKLVFLLAAIVSSIDFLLLSISVLRALERISLFGFWFSCSDGNSKSFL